MAIQTLPRSISALRGPVVPVRGRGRPAVAADATDNIIEIAVLRREAQQAENILPLARYVHRAVSLDCDPGVERAQGIVVNFLERQARRGTPPEAA